MIWSSTLLVTSTLLFSTKKRTLFSRLSSKRVDDYKSFDYHSIVKQVEQQTSQNADFQNLFLSWWLSHDYDSQSSMIKILRFSLFRIHFCTWKEIRAKRFEQKAKRLLETCDVLDSQTCSNKFVIK